MKIFIPYTSGYLAIETLREISDALDTRMVINHLGRPRIRKTAPGVTGIPHHAFNVKLFPETERYRSLSLPSVADKSPRRLNAICWHGFRAWMRAAFNEWPDATIRTKLAEYMGRDDFNRKHPDTFQGYSNHTCNCDPWEEDRKDAQASCSHSWVAGMVYVSQEDLPAVAALRAVSCERCDKLAGLDDY